MLPPGVRYVDSRISERLETSFQLNGGRRPALAFRVDGQLARSCQVQGDRSRHHVGGSVIACVTTRADARFQLGVSAQRRAAASRIVFRSDNAIWSLYGAQRSQPVATGGKWDGADNGSNKQKPLPWFATGCLSRSLVRRGSTVRVRQRALAKAPGIGAFSFRSTCTTSIKRWVWSRLWSLQVHEPQVITPETAPFGAMGCALLRPWAALYA